LKEKGFRLAVDSSFYKTGELGSGSPIFELADIITVDFPTVSLTLQKEMIRKTKHRVMFLADRIETWEDWRVARDMDYSLFRGYFFMWPEPGSASKDIKSLDACLINILTELDTPEPSFKKISELIEHDLGLSYRLLRLVNSAYMAPKYKISSISHALTYLGTRELHQWISMLLMGGIKSAENSELVKMSLIRGKFMTLVAQELQLAGLSSEPFFTGLFSLIDVIFNKDMRELMAGLPLPDNVRLALQGGTGELSRLLSFVVDYEQARWDNLDGKYPLDRLDEEKLVSLYLQAHQWSKILE
jgi:EAL and modified HD-GYP domain-containing signal transduction protein